MSPTATPRAERKADAGTVFERGHTASLDAYLSTIARRPLLSPPLERRLARRARAGSERARGELIERNLRLVIPTAKKFRGQGLALEDLIQEGNAGLVKAADRFDPELGYRFSTYAVLWIHQAITRAIAHQGRLIRVPAHVGEHRRAAYNATGRFVSAHGREPSEDELSRLTGLSQAHLKWAFDVPEASLSLQAPVSETDRDGLTIGSTLSDPEQTQEVAAGARSVLWRVEVERHLGYLGARERQVIERRYGLHGRSPATQREVCDELGLADKTVGAIESRARKRLRTVLRAHEVDHTSA